MENQSTIILIEDEDKNEAQFMSRNFVDSEIKNRVYLNALGAEVVTKYLNSEGIDTDGIHNLHSISKIIESIDISDILLPNIHLDVRVVFDENQIFVPISHFDIGLTPDVYVVLKISEDFASASLLGYFTPKQINKNNKNSKYYFVGKEKLSSVQTLPSFVRNFAGDTSVGITEEDLLRGRTLSISLSDHDLSKQETQDLIKLLLASDELRESVLEFDNFETLSFNVAQAMNEISVEEDIELTSTEENVFEENSTDLSEDDSSEDGSLDENNEVEDNLEVEENEEKLDIDNIDINTEDIILPDEDINIDDIDENIVENNSKHEENNGLDLIEKGLDVATDISGAIAAGTLGAAGASIAAETLAAGAATQGAIDLAGVAGDTTENLLNFVEDEQLHTFSQVPIFTKDAKEEMNKVQDEFHEPKDLSDFQQVESLETIESIEPETVELSSIESKDFEQLNFENNDEEHLMDFLNIQEQEEKDTQTENEIESFDLIEDSPVDLNSDDEVEDENKFQDSENLYEEEKNETDNVENEEDEIEEVEGINEQDNKSEEEWISDTNYDDLEDIEPEKEEQNDFNYEDFINEPENLEESVDNIEKRQVIENSAVISDKNFAVGEIEIDINKSEDIELEGSEHLEHLYNEDENVPGSSLLNGPGILNRPSKGLGFIGIIVSLIIVGVIGISISKMMKGPKEEAPQPVVDTNNVPETKPESEALNVNEGNVVNMENTTSPIVTEPVASKPKPAAQVETPKQTKTLAPTQFIGVSKLSWEVPDYVSQNQAFRQYFQSAGKSLKLSLTSDLLLASDYVYSDQVRVSVNFTQDGSLKDARILLSSGSQQVDKIVLQTVNQTLRVLKAPHSVGNDSGTTTILKIYF